MRAYAVFKVVTGTWDNFAIKTRYMSNLFHYTVMSKTASLQYLGTHWNPSTGCQPIDRAATTPQRYLDKHTFETTG